MMDQSHVEKTCNYTGMQNELMCIEMGSYIERRRDREEGSTRGTSKSYSNVFGTQEKTLLF